MHKILVIEDNNEVRENLVEILELSNYEVVEAATGKEGVKRAKQELPDLILCDIMMPEMDGYEVLYLLGKDQRTQDIPFIYLTAKAEKEDFRQGMNLGADDYLTKPFDDVELLNAIERRLTKYQKLKELGGAGNPDSFLSGAASLNEGLSGILKSERTYKKNDIIYREGDFPHYLYYLATGKVKVYKISEDGKEFILDVHKEGTYFGYNSLLRDSVQTDFAACMEDAEIKLISRDDFNKLIHEDRNIAGEFVKHLAKEVTDKEKELLLLAYDTVRRRVATNLLKLAEAYDDRAEFKIARNDLAGMVGTAAESVIRVLSEFKKEEIIEVHASGIRILDKQKLESIKW